MSGSEKRAVTELIIWAFLLAFTWMRLTDGTTILGQSLGSPVVEQAPSRVLLTYLTVGIVGAILHFIVYAYFRSRGEQVEFKDERDLAIERKAAQTGYWVGIAAINVIIVHVLATEVSRFGRTMPLDFSSPTGLVLALLTVILVQEIIKNGVLLALDRRS